MLSNYRNDLAALEQYNQKNHLVKKPPYPRRTPPIRIKYAPSMLFKLLLILLTYYINVYLICLNPNLVPIYLWLMPH